MINRTALLNDLQKLLVKLQDDLRARCVERPDVEAPLRIQYEAARSAKRTAEAYEAWREAQFTQAAVAWILSCVFIRFLEDNGLFGDIAYLSGPGPRLALARDQHTIYFRQHPTESDREYLYHVFHVVRGLPGLASLFHDTHNPVWRLGLSGDGAQRLLEFWQKLNAEEGQDLEHAPLVHDFSDPNLDTRFLGDLYQDLSEDAKKRFALLQTPIFIEEFILDRTLTPAIETFGYQNVRMIDCTCGSGHFALGGFHRLFVLHQRNHPAVEVRALAQRALDQVFGVDLNPFAVAIARFRLLLAALHVCDIHRLAHAPAFEVHIATGDSLLHGSLPGEEYRRQSFLGGHDVLEDSSKHFYETEDAELARHILGQQYHAVVGNPPYITVKDRALSEIYRRRYSTCHRKYSLAVPFMERFFDLAVKGDGTPQQPGGFVGKITANSFMKREFGKKLVEEYLPRWDLTHVVDTSHAYIPDYGTPTVILFGRNQPPVASTIRTVLGIKGEDVTPPDPAEAAVWRAILAQIDQAKSEGEWVSSSNSPRATFSKHPWSIGGGGAGDLKEAIEEGGVHKLGALMESCGFGSIVGDDDAFTFPPSSQPAHRLPPALRRPFVEGDTIRDWSVMPDLECLFPYDANVVLLNLPEIHRFLWALRTVLGARKDFSKKTYAQCGRPFWEFHQIPMERNRDSHRIAFAFVATHNQFVFDVGAKVFKQSAPIISLLRGSTETTHLQLVAILNSSTACFWLKQVLHDKGSGGIGGGLATERWEHFFEFTGTKLANFPLPEHQPSQLPTALVKTSTTLQGQSPGATLTSWGGSESGELRPWLASARDLATRHRRQLIAWQEELDWQIYEAFGLVEGTAESGPAAVSLPEGAAMDAIPPEGIELGQRAFEIVLARRMAAGEAQSKWFERHGSTPITQVPRHWPAPYRDLVERRIRRIADDANIRLIEQPEYKRRWNTEPWKEQQERALREWLLGRLESVFGVPPLGGAATEPAEAGTTNPELTSCAHLADKVRRDTEFMEVATLYRSRPDFDLTELVVEMVESESVPFLPVLRYKESGLRKRAIWEQVWDLQREEDRLQVQIEELQAALKKQPEHAAELQSQIANLKSQMPQIPVPPKYDTKDFVSTTFWRLRGKLDVPKERFITYPHCNRDADRTPVIGWAGWNHLQQAQAVAGYYERMRTNEGWTDDRLLPLLAGVLELIPWLLQWHNGLDPQYGMGMGDFFRSFAEEEARRMGKTLDEVRAWQPPEKPGRKQRMLI
jgi:hypothetical protein